MSVCMLKNIQIEVFAFIIAKKQIMRKITIPCTVLCTVLMACSNDQEETTNILETSTITIPKDIKLRTAEAFDERINYKLENDPEFAARYAENEAYIEAYTKEEEEKAKSGKRNLPLYTIKVVVNNIYRRAPMAMARIQRQMDRLNEAFAGQLTGRPSGLPSNAERFNVGDTRIRFVLDEVKTRRNQRNFSSYSEYYSRSTGGINPTSPDTRLNIYVANLSESTNFDAGIIGNAGFPGEEDSSLDNVFVDREAFDVRSGDGVFNEGKLLVHEVGHYLNLSHLPGRRTSNCRFDDAVGDTPNSSRLYFGNVNTGSSTTSCGSQDMYWNFMANTDDSEIFMFTTGQRTRMRATLDPSRGLRADLTNAD